MSFQIKHALNVPFGGKHWELKLLIGVLLICIMPIMVVLFGKNIIANLLAFVFSMIPFGYIYMSIHNELNNEEVILPNWNIMKCLSVLLNIFLIKIIYILPIFPVAFGIAYMYIKIPSVKVLAIVLGIFVLLTYGIFMFFVEGSFLKNYKLKEAFNFSRNINLFQAGYGKFIIAQLWSMLVGLIISIPLVIVLFIIGFILMILLKTLNAESFQVLVLAKQTIKVISYFFIYLICFNLSAQAYKMAEMKLDKEKNELQINQ